MFGLETLLAIIHHAKNCTCSPLEDASEDAFARGLGAGLGSGCVTTCPPFMYSNTANSSPFSYGPFIVASTRSPVERVKIAGRPG